MVDTDQSPIEFSLTDVDYKEYAVLVRKNYSYAGAYKFYAWLAFLTPCVVGLVVARWLVGYLIAKAYLPNDVTMFAFLVYFAVIYFCKWLAELFFKPTMFDDKGGFCAARKVTINPEGIYVISENFQVATGWRGVTKIQNSREYILFFVDKFQAHLIPKRCFSDEKQVDAFLRQASIYWQAVNTAKS